MTSTTVFDFNISKTAFGRSSYLGQEYFFPEKNVSIELASYLTTIFNPSFLTRMKQLDQSANFPPSYLDSNLDLILNGQDLTLPELLLSVVIKSVML